MFYEGKCSICGKSLSWDIYKKQGELSVEKNFDFCPACLSKVCVECIDPHLRSAHGIG